MNQVVIGAPGLALDFVEIMPEAKTKEYTSLPPGQELAHVHNAPGMTLEFPGEPWSDLGERALFLPDEVRLHSLVQYIADDCAAETPRVAQAPKLIRQENPNVIPAERIAGSRDDGISGQRRDGLQRRIVRRGESPRPNAICPPGRKEQAHQAHEPPTDVHVSLV